MVQSVNNISHYLRNNAKGRDRVEKLQDIIYIVGAEPTQMTQVIDMCVDYTLKTLQANPNELDNMEMYNTRKRNFQGKNINTDTQIINIKPTYAERQMLEFLKEKTFIKNYADLYSYALSCVSEIEKIMEE